MAKKSSSKRRPATRVRKQQKRTDRIWSVVIPSVVGVVLVAVVVGAIILNESRQAGAAAATTPNINVPVVTVAPQPTQPLPFPNIERTTLKETQELLAAGQAVLVDVRSRASFDQDHAAGALSFPEEEIASRLSELPRDKQLILYCT